MDLTSLGLLNQHEVLNGHYGIFNSDVGFKQFRKSYADLLSGSTKIYNIVALGDSLTEGGIADASNPQNWPYKSWLGLFRTALANKFEFLGIGFVPVHYPYGKPFWTFNAGWSLIQDDQNYKWGVGNSFAMGSSGTGTCTFSFSGIGCSIYTANGSSGGKFTYQIDSGTTYTVDTSLDGDKYGIGVTTTNTVAQGSHTLTITMQATGKDVVLFGAMPFNSATNGFRVHCNARWGKKSGDFCKSTDTDFPTGGSYFCEGLEIAEWNPVLTIIALITNDAMDGTPTPIASYTNNIQHLIDIAQYVGSDVWLINDCATDAMVANNASSKPYADALLQLAIKNGCAYSDLASFFGPSGSLNAYGVEASDDTHLNALGHQMFENRMINQLFNSL